MSRGTAQSINGDEGSVPIAKILDDPDEFHLMLIPLKGTVTEVTALAPYYIPSGAGCYGAYTFTLSDQTGSIHVEVLGICGTPVFRPPPVLEGDRVMIQAHVRAPGHEGYFQGLIGIPVPERPPTTVRAIARQIQQASPEPS